MRSTIALAMLLLSFALLTPSCAKLDFFKRRESVRTAQAGPRVGTPAPEIDADDFNGKRVKLSDYRGKVVVLVFWYANCPPCRAMIPHERELVERLRDKPFAMISVYGDVDYEKARDMIAAQHMTWPIVKSGADAIARYGVTSFPNIFVIDAAGVVRYRSIMNAELDSAVATLLGEMEASAHK